MKRISVCTAMLFASVLAAQAVLAERPPSDAKPLSEIVKILESQGYAPVVDVEFDDGVWEVEAYRDGAKMKLKVNPESGDIVSNRRAN